MFEAATDRAVDLFCDLETNTSVCRLAVVGGNVHAIYTPELSPDFRRIAADISRIFDYAYYALVCDESVVEVWKSGNLWVPGVPGRRGGQKLLRQIEANVFTQSNAISNGKLWKKMLDFVWGDFGDLEFLLEK